MIKQEKASWRVAKPGVCKPTEHNFAKLNRWKLFCSKCGVTIES